MVEVIRQPGADRRLRDAARRLGWQRRDGHHPGRARAHGPRRPSALRRWDPRRGPRKPLRPRKEILRATVGPGRPPQPERSPWPKPSKSRRLGRRGPRHRPRQFHRADADDLLAHPRRPPSSRLRACLQTAGASKIQTFIEQFLALTNPTSSSCSLRRSRLSPRPPSQEDGWRVVGVVCPGFAPSLGSSGQLVRPGFHLIVSFILDVKAPTHGVDGGRWARSSSAPWCCSTPGDAGFCRPQCLVVGTIVTASSSSS
jgi:hypothetical protein